ncbi:MAG: FkbM family methyltransferase [Terriglobales bacterium]
MKFALLRLTRRSGYVPLRRAGRVLVRARTSDAEVFEEIYADQQYAHPLLPRARRILDLGACTGLASAFLSGLYPQAQVVALEADPSNYAALQANARGRPAISCRLAAVWDRRGTLRIQNPDAPAWAKTVAEVGPGAEVKAMSINDLLDELGWDTVDLVKMDIEGAERRVLQAGDWLRRTRALLIELHERTEPGCRAALESAIAAHWGVGSARRDGRVLFLVAPDPPCPKAAGTPPSAPNGD